MTLVHRRADISVYKMEFTKNATKVPIPVIIKQAKLKMSTCKNGIGQKNSQEGYK